LLLRIQTTFNSQTTQAATSPEARARQVIEE
jgi:hypothetical protein